MKKLDFSREKLFKISNLFLDILVSIEYLIKSGKGLNEPTIRLLAIPGGFNPRFTHFPRR